MLLVVAGSQIITTEFLNPLEKILAFWVCVMDHKAAILFHMNSNYCNLRYLNGIKEGEYSLSKN